MTIVANKIQDMMKNELEMYLTHNNFVPLFVMLFGQTTRKIYLIVDILFFTFMNLKCICHEENEIERTRNNLKEAYIYKINVHVKLTVNNAFYTK